MYEKFQAFTLPADVREGDTIWRRTLCNEYGNFYGVEYSPQPLQGGSPVTVVIEDHDEECGCDECRGAPVHGACQVRWI